MHVFCRDKSNNACTINIYLDMIKLTIYIYKYFYAENIMYRFSISLYGNLLIYMHFLAHVTTKFDDNCGCNIHQLQQSVKPRREARVRHSSISKFANGKWVLVYGD
jgi:hypothetical protein